MMVLKVLLMTACLISSATCRLRSQYHTLPLYTVTAPERYFCYGAVLCSTDLKGWYDGCYSGKEIAKIPGKQYYVECPQGTRCGCQPDDICPPHLHHNPCVPITPPHPMQLQATFTFNGNTRYNYFFGGSRC